MTKNNTPLTEEELSGKIDVIIEDLMMAPNFEWAGETLKILFSKELAKVRAECEKEAITSSRFLLKSHRDALYNLLPTGDIDAWQLLKSVQQHLNNVDEALATLPAPIEEENI
jgi:hypothetical protein